jgi:DNA-binding NarL/FixJ family response regulator
MSVLDGFSAAERIKKALSNVPLLRFLMHDGPEVIQARKLVQAQGFVAKSEDASVLLDAVEALLRGENFFPDNGNLESVRPSSRDSA